MITSSMSVKFIIAIWREGWSYYYRSCSVARTQGEWKEVSEALRPSSPPRTCAEGTSPPGARGPCPLRMRAQAACRRPRWQTWNACASVRGGLCRGSRCRSWVEQCRQRRQNFRAKRERKQIREKLKYSGMHFKKYGQDLNNKNCYTLLLGVKKTQ